MREMTGRERVAAALEHKEPDLVPIDFGATRSTGINALAYRELLDYLNIEEEVKVFDFKQLLAEPGEQISRMFGSDCIALHRLAPSAGVQIDEYRRERLMDGKEYLVPKGFCPEEQKDGSSLLIVNGVPILKRPADGLYFDDCYHPLEETVNEFGDYPLPGTSEKELLYLKERARDLRENTDKAIVASTGISIFEKGIKDWGYEEFLVRIYTEPELVKSYLEQLTEAYLQFLDLYLEAVGPYTNIFQCNDDLGMQTSTLISPQVYRKVFKPYHKKIYSYIKERVPGSHILLHSCGSIYDLIPDLIETGVDALNPVQINAEKMDPGTLKREFGRDITFWGGGCSTQTTLSFGTLEEIEDETKRMIETFAPGGGFVFNQVHNIQSNVSPQRIIKLYETAKRYRKL